MKPVNLDVMLARFAEHRSPKKIAQVNDYDVRGHRTGIVFPLPRDPYHRPTSANGQPAAAAYLWVEQAGAFTLEGLHVLTLRGGEIEEIMAFRSPRGIPRLRTARIDRRLTTATTRLNYVKSLSPGPFPGGRTYGAECR